MTDVKKEALGLEHIFYIHYPVQFKKDTNKTQVHTMIDLESEVNAIYPTFVKKLGLPISSTDVEAQKIDSIMLYIYGILVAVFSITNKANRVRFFKETFLVANLTPKVVFGMLFLILSGIDIDFLDQKLW